MDAVSSLGSIDYRHDEWGVDVTVSGSQKGLRLPPGLSFNAIGKRAVEASRYSTLPKHLRKLVLERFNLSLGSGLGKLTGRAFRIGHLGDFNELMLGGTLCGVEMGLASAFRSRKPAWQPPCNILRNRHRRNHDPGA